MRNDFDVIIVGARCAGAGTALLLARAGVRVAVIDKGSYGSDTLSTHALMRGAVMQLDRWGVLPRIQAAGTPPIKTTLFGYRTSQTSVTIEPRYGVEALYAPRRTVLDRALIDEATDAGAHVMFNAAFGDVLRSASGRVTGVTMKGSRGPTAINAGLVIGADGLYSSVARRVGARTLWTGKHATANLYSYWHGVAADGYEWHYDASASVGTIPTNRDLVCVFLSVPQSDLATIVRSGPAAGYEHELQTRFPAFADRLRAARRAEPVRGFGGQAGFLRQAAGTGWALVGDAGYFKDPLTAHGITDALRDAELLARAVLSGTEEAFAQYAQTRHDLSQDLFETTDAIASFTWTDDELQALHRRFSREMSREQRVLAALEPFTWQPSRSASAPLAV